MDNEKLLKRPRGECPVKKDQVIPDLLCEVIGVKGDGMFKIDGFAIFVPDTQAGERYTIKITRVLPTVAFGEIVE